MPTHFNLDVRRGGLKAKTKWTPDKRRLGIEMRAAGETFVEIGRVLGISGVACAAALADAPCPRNPNERRKEYSRAHHSEKAPASVIAERERRYEAANRRSLSASLFGDPPPGFSALDQKKSAGA